MPKSFDLFLQSLVPWESRSRRVSLNSFTCARDRQRSGLIRPFRPGNAIVGPLIIVIDWSLSVTFSCFSELCIQTQIQAYAEENRS